MGQPSPRPCMSVCLVCNIFSVALFGIRKGGTDYRARVCNSESADKKQIKGVCAELWKRKYEFSSSAASVSDVGRWELRIRCSEEK